MYLKIIWAVGICVLNLNYLYSQFYYPKEFDTLVIHHLSNTKDSILEGRTHSGLSDWYGYKVQQNVCLDGVCNPIEIWIIWDCVGRYESLEIIPGKHLTKIHHEVFSNSDYDFLNRILQQEDYIFKDLEYEDLINLQEKTDEDHDAFTGATRKDLSHYVVEGAAYSCFVLWKKVHGILKTRVQKLAIRNSEESYLRSLLESNDPKHGELAILIISSSSDLQKNHQNDLINFMKSDNENLSLNALHAAQQISGDLNFQKKILGEFLNMSPRMRQEIVWQLFRHDSVDPKVILMLIAEFMEGRIGPHELSLVVRMIATQSLKDERKIHDALIILSTHENSFVRRITSNLLQD